MLNLILSIRVLDIEERIAEYCLKSTELRNGNLRWIGITEEFVGPDYEVKIITNSDKEVLEVYLGELVVDNNYEVKEKFLNEIECIRTEQDLIEKDGFERVDEREEEYDISDPYDPKKIRVDPRNHSIREIKTMIENKEIDLSPDFQRGFVWTDITRKSRLIESILLRIPLPVFYVAETCEGVYQVVDGVQRLSVLNSYMNNEFKLKNTEYLKDCEGKYYNVDVKGKKENIPLSYKRRIDNTNLYFNVIDAQTPSQVKFDIFKRINTGGKALNRQEIRNCFAAKKTRDLLRDLAHSDNFLVATRSSISSTRMADQDIILRFIAFYMQDNQIGGQKEYTGGMDNYLDNTVEVLNSLSSIYFERIRIAFLNAMDNAYLLFREKAFRKAKFINKALFLGMTRVLSKYEPREIEKYAYLKTELEMAFKRDNDFINALTNGTNDVKRIKYVYKKIDEMMKGVK